MEDSGKLCKGRDFPFLIMEGEKMILKKITVMLLPGFTFSYYLKGG